MMNKLNLIFILLDGFRRDKIGIAPFLEGFAGRCLFFSNAVTSAPYTIAAMHSIFSGVYPGANGVNGYYNMLKFKKNKFRTMAEYFRDNGFYCAADVMSESIAPKRGFEHFHPHNEYEQDMFELHKDLLDRCAGKRFFAYLHYSSIHTDLILNVAKRYDDFSEEYFRNKEENEKRYNDSIKKCDDYLKRVIGHIEKIGMMENSVIVAASDHGCSLGEKKGEKMYGSFLYDYTLKAFFMIKVPGMKANEFKVQVRHIDLMPTILELFGIEKDKRYKNMQGKSLLGFVRGEEKGERAAFSETGGIGGPWPSREKHNVFCIRANGYKLIFNVMPKTWEMYNLSEDPFEQNNIIKEESAIKKEMIRLLLEQMEENKGLGDQEQVNSV